MEVAEETEEARLILEEIDGSSDGGLGRVFSVILSSRGVAARETFIDS